MYENPEDRTRRLEHDRNSLTRQVSVLTDQIEGQGQRVRELEYELEKMRQKNHYAEEMYHKVSTQF